MILRPLILLTSLLTLIQAGFWPSIVDRAALNIRQVIGGGQTEETTEAAAGAGTQQTTQAANAAAGAAAANTETTRAAANAAGAGAVAAEPTTAAAAPGNAANAAAAAADDDDTETTSTSTARAPAAAAPVAPAAAPAAPAAPAADPEDFSIPFSMQTGTIKYAPMPVKAPSKITKKDMNPLYPTSDANILTTAAGAGSVVQTVTQPITYSTVSREATVSISLVTFLRLGMLRLTILFTIGDSCCGTAHRRRYAEIPKSVERLSVASKNEWGAWQRALLGNRKKTNQRIVYGVKESKNSDLRCDSGFMVYRVYVTTELRRSQ
jgi:hypothetical protein